MQTPCGHLRSNSFLVEGGGFEPPKAEPSDLQSDPFGRSGTPPKRKPRILIGKGSPVNSGRRIFS
jgi:hypothetical protein